MKQRLAELSTFAPRHLSLGKRTNLFLRMGYAVFELIPPLDEDIALLYGWKTEERHHVLYSCRPVNPLGTYEEFSGKVKSRLEDPDRIHRILNNRETDERLGEISGFDFNPRNQSIEFMYYMPVRNRIKVMG